MKKLWLLPAVVLLCFQYVFAQQVFNVRDYGAGGEKNQTVTAAIQKAIDACHQQGGGKVVFPAGDYLSGAATGSGMNGIIASLPGNRLPGGWKPPSKWRLTSC